MLPILAEYFELNISLFDPQGNETLKFERSTNPEAEPIYLVYSGSHYDATVKVTDE